MSSLVDILFNAAGGGVVGSLLHLGTSWFDVWRKKKDAEVEIMLLQAKIEAADKEAAWGAFTASQNASGAVFAVPATVSPWVANIFTLVEALNRVTRSALCWIGVMILTGVYFSATPEQQQVMQPEVQFGVWTMIFWFFGARYTKSPPQSVIKP